MVKMSPRSSRPAVGTRSVSYGLPHHTSAFDSLLVSEVAQAAVGGSRAPRWTPDLCVLFWLIEPACSLLSYSCTESVVPDSLHLFTDLRDMNSLHGQTGFGRSWSCWSPDINTEMRTSEPGERSVVVLTLIASLAILSPS